jgi:tyrosine decarboxylase
VNSTGKAYLTHTVLGDKIALRVAVGNVLTTERDLRETFDLLTNTIVIQEAVAE